MRQTLLTAATMTAVLILLVGCSAGPDYVRPDLDLDVPASWSVADTAATGSLPAMTPDNRQDGCWWTAFQDTTLDSLVARAMQYNDDLVAAAARVQESRALAKGAAADRWPTIEIGGTASRNKSANLNFPNFISPYLSAYSVNATGRDEIDLWGRLARGDEAAVATLLASESDRADLVRNVVAEVVRARLETLELARQLSLAQTTIENYDLNRRIVWDRYGQGLVPALDVDLATQNLAAAQAAASPLQIQLAAARRRIEILCGSYPQGLDPHSGDLINASFPVVLPAVPEALPSDLLERRPDLQAAELRLHAAVARIGQAKAALYPRISLTASTGSSSRELSQLGKAETNVWSLVGNLVMPLINRGATKAQIQAAEARAAQAAAAYRKNVLEAFSEVENALDRDYYLSLQERDLRRSVTAAKSAVRQAEDRYQRGLDNILILLETQRRAFTTESQFLTVSRLRQAARVDLILALGGPWDPSFPTSESGTIPAPSSNQGVQP